MDDIDLRILSCLQRDSSQSVGEIADQVGLSATPCWRRIQNLEKAGVVRSRVALLDPDKLGVGITVFVRVNTSDHSAEWLERFAEAVARIDEVVEFHRLSGDIDYLLKIVIPDIAGYDAVYKRLIQSVAFSDVSSSFVMETIKQTTELPLRYAQ